MKAKEYLEQAHYIDVRINSRIEQVEALHQLATKATSTVSDLPGSPNRNVTRMEDVIIRIVEEEDLINQDIYRLVELKKEIRNVISQVKNPEYMALLELRYLCFRTWEQISVEMDYGSRYVHTLHKKALEAVERLLADLPASA